ncbi:MAG: acyltransferase, partial [Spirochaetales bacterium]|nr:acyltransferase [Spirochaetales bacterium]
WFSCLTVLATMKRFADQQNSFTRFMSRKSFGLYVFHYLPLAALSPLLVYKTNLPPVVIYIVVAVASFVGGYLLNEIVSRIPIVRWCVLGIYKNTKKVIS